MLIYHSLSPPYLPPGWSVCNHPDGSTYYFQANPPLKVVTRADMTNPEVQDSMSRYIHDITLVLNERHMLLLRAAIEIFLELPADHAIDGPLHFYFIDHGSHTAFWIDPVDTGLLGLPSVSSEMHLRPCRQCAPWFADHVSRSLVQCCGLQKIYWEHVSRFPSHHRASHVPVIGQLIDALVLGFTGEALVVVTR